MWIMGLPCLLYISSSVALPACNNSPLNAPLEKRTLSVKFKSNMLGEVDWKIVSLLCNEVRIVFQCILLE